MWYDETWPEGANANSNDSNKNKKNAKNTSCPVDELGMDAVKFVHAPDQPAAENPVNGLPKHLVEARSEMLIADKIVAEKPSTEMHANALPDQHVNVQPIQQASIQPKQRVEVKPIPQAHEPQKTPIDAQPKQQMNNQPNPQMSAEQISVSSIEDTKINSAEATLEELMEAELSGLTPEQEVKHLAVMAAFENSLKVETVVQDVAEVCEEIRDYSEDHPISMPKVSEWEGLGPVSRFGMGGKTKEIGLGRVKTAVSGFVFGRPTLATGTVLASLMVAAFAYSGPEVALKFATDIIPGSPEQTEANNRFVDSGLNSNKGNGFIASTEEEGSQDEQPLVIGKPVFANAVVNTESFERFEPAQRAPETGEQLMVSSSTHQQSSAGGVTVVAKMPELVKEPDFQEILSNLATKLQVSRALAQTESGQRIGKTGQSGPALALVASRERPNNFNKVLEKPRPRNTVAVQPRNETRVRARPVKTLSFNSSNKISAKGRDEKTVLLAMLNAKAGYTLTEDQKSRLMPKLIGGACVATSLKEVAGRVSPVLMRDLLTRLNSDC